MGGDSGSLKYPYIEACIELMLLGILFLLLPCSQIPRQLGGNGGLEIRLSVFHPRYHFLDCHLRRALALLDSTSVSLSVNRDNISSSIEGLL